MQIFNFHKWPNRSAFRDESGASVTYGELAILAEKLFCARPTKCLAFVFSHNTLGGLASLASLIEAGHVVAPIAKTYAHPATQSLLEAYQPELIAAPHGGVQPSDEYQLLMSVHDFQIWVSRRQIVAPLYADLSLLLSTSGSTGSAKTVRITGNNIAANAKSIAAFLNLNPLERPMTSLPSSYSYGFSVISSHLSVGATILVTSRSVLERGFWDYFASSNATSLAGVPYTFVLLERLRFRSMDLPSLRYVTQAGGKLSADLVSSYGHYANSSRIRFFVMYGQTEATARMAYLPPEMTVTKPTSIGIAIPDGEMEVVDSAGCPVLKPGVIGELMYAGPNVALGYAQDRADLSLGDSWNGVLATRDLGFRDEDGFFYVTSRVDRVVKLLGHRLNLDELETSLEALGVPVACTPGETVVNIWCERESDKSIVTTHLRDEIQLNPVLFRVHVIKDIPRSASGKIQYSVLATD